MLAKRVNGSAQCFTDRNAAGALGGNSTNVVSGNRRRQVANGLQLVTKHNILACTMRQSARLKENILPS